MNEARALLLATRPPLPWPTTYWCVCAKNDCHASVFGPFETREEAVQESNGRCPNAHFVSTGYPHETMDVRGSVITPHTAIGTEWRYNWHCWINCNDIEIREPIEYRKFQWHSHVLTGTREEQDLVG